MLKGKKILLGISGSIAAYKITSLIRTLTKSGAEVRVVATPSALSFVTPLTLSTLSNNPVHSAYVKDGDSGEWTNHVELGKWPDLMVFAPLSANTLAKMVSGECDNLLMAVYLSASCPILAAPAMDLDMADHWTTERNIETLRSRGVNVLDFGEGELASGLVGKGRMQEPEAIFVAIQAHFKKGLVLTGKHVVVTAGPTFEAIDPVRFIGNHSSGKMGFAIAEEALKLGASVTLITGPTYLAASPEIKRVSVVSAADMHAAVKSTYANCDALVMSAAVADYRPKTVAQHKLKKGEVDLTRIDLEQTVDILAECGKNKLKQVLVGFALETNNEVEHGRAKLKNKNLDMLVLNSLNDKGAGFGTDTNKVTFLFNDRAVEHQLKSKQQVAEDIIKEIIKLLEHA